ncbi:phenylalanine--tRNA ligase subunit beta [bacterium]|nr:phenylalanine--tRNA ligase subunit beta [bacterium]
MKFTLSWLKDHLDTTASIDAIVDAMTMAGLEVETVHDPAARLKDFSIAKVIEAKPHPDADRLRVCTVETKDGVKQIVCGAPNARTGMTAVYAPLGAFIPGLDFTLDAKPRKIRGVESHGMMCSAKELELGEDHDGIIDLEGDFTVGAPAAEALGLNDPVVDFEVTPNRPDWLGVVGVARDLAALRLGALRLAPVAPVKGTFPCPVDIRIEAPDACPVFAGRLIRGVKNGPSPGWLQDRLKAIGINPKSLLVDVTNYISFDRARPLHVYDAAKLKGPIRARLGAKGDRFEGLDGETYEPTPDMCVIADESGAIGFGGVMGGASTGVSAGTTDVFIESAWFDPTRTARTGRATGILSDARFRFERGVDPQSHIDGLELATRLILDHGGGEPSEVRVAGQAPAAPATVNFRVADMRRLTGVAMDPERMEAILRALGFDPVITAKGRRKQDVWPVEVPSFRPDIEGSADIVEELIRIEGFAALPNTPLPPLNTVDRVVVTPLQTRVRTGRRVLAARGFLEAVSWSFMARDKAALMLGGGNALKPELTIENPIASDLDYMRPSALANLAEAAQRNADRGAEEVRLFEAGPIYPGDGPDDQQTMLTALVRPRTLRHWAEGRAPYDVFAAKADLFAVLTAVDFPPERLTVGEADGPHWHPGRAGVLKLGPTLTIARFGELHPGFLKALGCDGPMIAIEVNLSALPAGRAKPGKTKPVFDRADQTPVRRDFAFVVAETVAAGDIVKLAMMADPKLITGVSVFDVYRGSGVPEGSKSIAIEVTLQPRGAAMTDAEIDVVAKAVIASVAKGAGATLRG